MDENANPIAQAFGAMIQQKQTEYKQQAIAHMTDPDYDPYPSMHQKVIDPNQPEAVQSPSLPQSTTYPPPPPEPAPPISAPIVQNLVQNVAPNVSVQTLANEAERLYNLQSGDEISLH
jgi:hypothetical protein